MRYFIDTEFIEDGKTIDLISIGIVSSDGREYYAISTEFDESKVSGWVKENVISQLEPRNQSGATFWKPRSHIQEDLLLFFAGGIVGNDKDQYLDWDEAVKGIEFWGYYADYDWVVFCQMFGTMMDLPKGFPMYCRDIKQWCDQLGNPNLPEQGKGEHNALGDAQWNKQAWEFLSKYSEDCVVERN